MPDNNEYPLTGPDNHFMKLINKNGKSDNNEYPLTGPDNPFMKLITKKENPIKDEYDVRSLQSLQESFSGVTPEGMDRPKYPDDWKKVGDVGGEVLGMGGTLAGSLVGAKAGGIAGTTIMPGVGTAIGGVAGSVIGGGIGYYTGKSIADKGEPGKAAEMSGEMGGMVAGSKIGSRGGAIGAIAGGALGYAGVKAAERIVKGTTSKSIPDAGLEVLKDTAIGVLMEMGGKAAGWAIQKISSPVMGKFVNPVTKAIDEDTKKYVDAAESIGYNYTAAEFTGNKGSFLSRIIEGTLPYMPFSAGIINKRRVENLNTLIKARNNILLRKNGNEKDLEDIGYRIKERAAAILKEETSKIKNVSKEQIDGLTTKFVADVNATTTASEKDFALSSELKSFLDTTGSSTTEKSIGGKTVQDLLADVKTEKYTAASEKLESARRFFGEDEVKLLNTRNIADTLLEEEMAGSLRNPAVIKILREFSSDKTPIDIKKWFPNEASIKNNREVYDALTSEISSYKRSWNGLDKDRIRLGELIREANDLSGTKYSGSKGSMSSSGRVYYLLKQSIMDDMAGHAISKNKDAYMVFMEGKNEWKTAENLFDFDTLKIMKKPPEDVFRTIVNPEEVTNIRKMKEIIGDKYFKPMKEIFTRNIIATDKNGVFDVVGTKRNINKYGETFNEVFNEKEREQFGKLITNATEIEKRNSKGMALNDVLAIDKNGIINAEATKKKIAERKNIDKLKSIYTQEELSLLNNFVDNVGNVNLNHLASNKSEAMILLGNIARKDAAGIVTLLVRPNNTARLTYLKKFMGEELTEEVKTKFIGEYLIKINQYGNVSPKDMIKKYKEYEKTIGKMFDKETAKEIENMMIVAKRCAGIESIASNTSQTGQVITSAETLNSLTKSVSSLLLSVFSVGGGVAYAGGHPVMAAASGLAVAFTPAVIAKLYLSPVGRKYLTLGYLIPSGTKQAVEFLVKLSEVAGVKLPPNISKTVKDDKQQDDNTVKLNNEDAIKNEENYVDERYEESIPTKEWGEE
jgi:hypothetical protein